MTRNKVYFVADVHLGLKAGDPAGRERRFVSWLKSLPVQETSALYLLGDIWDFWYEYRDVVPREGTRVIAELIRLMDEGVEVVFFPGNHDIWCYNYFESLGIRKLQQPQRVEIGGRRFLLGHGDALGGAAFGYRIMLWAFHNRVLQKLFSTLHPWFAFRFGTDWSNSNRRKHGGYKFRGAEEPLYKFCVEQCAAQPADYCIFGHFHDSVDLTLPGGERLIVLKDWIGGGEHFACFDGETLAVV
ncbi:MAG: UDP-2,3-diacylglucosamine diphosphatase [Bacteroidales bacterium]|nr:UDP-2,3-diacylglucosamine diphosphatase [Bacteroidales bacterium]